MNVITCPSCDHPLNGPSCKRCGYQLHAPQTVTCAVCEAEIPKTDATEQLVQNADGRFVVEYRCSDDL